MKKTIVTERLHVIYDVRAKDVYVSNNLVVEKSAVIKELTVEKIVDNGSGTFYGDVSLIKPLSADPALNKASAGIEDKAARVDHIHPIPEKIRNPHMLTVKNFQGTELFQYDGFEGKELTLSLANTGAAPKNHAHSSTAYGIGSSTLYGHLKLSDAVNSTSGVAGGAAATPAAVRSTYNLCRTVFSNAAPTANVVAGTFWVGLADLT